jgi:hypothetical protein
MPVCVAIKKDGNQCRLDAIPTGDRCRMHMKCMERNGPNTTLLNELKYRQSKEVADAIRLHNDENNNDTAEYNRVLNEITQRYEIMKLELQTRFARERHEGIDRDAEARNRRLEERLRRVALRRRVHEEWRERLRQRDVGRDLEAVQQVVAQVDALRAHRELEEFANDRQNVHTTVVVNKVKETVEKLLQIPVPEDYETETQKTVGEIILECDLSRKASWQMMAKYCQDEDIYDMGPGIYAKVLNAVWQYIKNSPDSADLKKILKAEMEDNVGMCAQGNLTRLCNIVAGYMDGINPDTKSRNEMIADKMVELLGSERPTGLKIADAILFLKELGVPRDEYTIWIEPLLGDDEDLESFEELLA